jgi:DNA-binding CsgD family transcriptional regulator
MEPRRKSLKPEIKAAWTEQFDQAYSKGRFAEAAEIFGDHPAANAPTSVVLRAASANMHTRPTIALRLLLEGSSRRYTGAESVRRELLLAEIYARTGDFESADGYLESALSSAEASENDDLIAAVGYRLIRRHLLNENPTSAREYLALARRGRSLSSRLHALYAETLILPYEERLPEQASKLIELLRQIDPNAQEFYEMRAWATQALAILTRELYLPDAAVEVERQLAGPPWPPDFLQNRFQALKALGWAKAILGDYFNGFRLLKQASQAAPTTAWRVVAACDRAYLARRFDEPRWSRVELDEAEQLSREVDWHATIGEERIGLVLMSELFASIDTARAAMYLAQYRELGQLKSPMYFKNDARLEAFESFSAAVVELALGKRSRGVALLRRAYSIFDRLQYDFRAALCLVTEFQATNKTDLLKRAERRIAAYGQSWLMAQIRSLTSSPSESMNLPPMQQRVFDELCQGKSSAEIAASIGRSEFTVKNHIKQIFKAFKVNSRSALLAQAIKR